MSKKNLHGTLLCLFGKGVLLQGVPGSGKSECALALLDRGHALVCDDAPLFEVRENRLFGSAPLNIAGLLEVRGLGIIEIKAHFGEMALMRACPLDLVIELREPALGGQEDRLPKSNLTFIEIMGISIPHLILSVMLKSHMAILVETAVRHVFARIFEPV